MRLILVCDGGEDPEFGFEDLQTALRRVGEDFGAKLEFVTEQPMEDMMSWPAERCYPRDLKLAKRGFAVARIHYPPDFEEHGLIKPADQCTESTLIYLNTTMVDGLPLELRGYVGKNPDFPDQSTGDQFFDEDQFEAYRGARLPHLQSHDRGFRPPGASDRASTARRWCAAEGEAASG